MGKKTVGLGKTEQSEKQNLKASTDQNSLQNKQTVWWDDVSTLTGSSDMESKMMEAPLLYNRSEKAGIGRENEGYFGSMNWYRPQVFSWVHGKTAFPGSPEVVGCAPCAWVPPNDRKEETHHFDRQLRRIIEIFEGAQVATLIRKETALQPGKLVSFHHTKPEIWNCPWQCEIILIYFTTLPPKLLPFQITA